MPWKAFFAHMLSVMMTSAVDVLLWIIMDIRVHANEFAVFHVIEWQHSGTKQWINGREKLMFIVVLLQRKRSYWLSIR